MGILAWILFGLIAGLLARAIMPGSDPAGCIVTVLLGIGGAFVGGLLGTHVFGFGEVTGFDLRSFGIAVLGALLLLAGFRLMRR